MPTMTNLPGFPVLAQNLMREGFIPLELVALRHNVLLPDGRGTGWNSLGDVPQAPGHFCLRWARTQPPGHVRRGEPKLHNAML